MTSVVNANPYKPNKLKIISVGIGIEDDTNENLQLTHTQAIIAAERRYVQPNGEEQKTFGMIVDKEGIGVNMTLEDRAAASNSYALQVDGNVFITGTLSANNFVIPSSGNTTSNFWVMGDRESANIYYPGGVTLGNNASTRSNMYTLNINQSADRNIDHAQISIQNTTASQLRLGIVGTSNVSPAVINTKTGVPIEFHASRTQQYFNERYKKWYYDSGALCNVPSEVPYYTSPDNAPHLSIDARGNVGIHTSTTPAFNYDLRIVNPNLEGQMIYSGVSNHMTFSVHGSAYTCNMLIWDYESGAPQNIDSLYVRRLGVTLQADQIIPGPFALGTYTFPYSLNVSNMLNVIGNVQVSDSLRVNSNCDVNHLFAYDAVLFDVASFCNDVYINRDMIVQESVRLKGGLFTEIPDNDGNLIWCNVQFTVSQPGFSNINYYGAGFTTPGRVGVGINGVDEVNHQFVVRKRDTRMYDMELTMPTARIIKSAYIGHPNIDPSRASDVFQDASTIFTTPDSHDPDYNLYGYADAPQNFYFYPGSYSSRRTESIVRQSNPPVLNVNTRKRVGINLFDPQYELDVAGSIRLTSNLYNGDDKVGIWRERTFPIGGGGTFTGLQYNYPSACSNVAINTIPDLNYGLVVGGKIKSINGYYTSSNEAIVPWISSTTPDQSFAGTDPFKLFTLGKVGIGVKAPTDTLELRDPYSAKTTIRLWRPERIGDNDPISSIEFDGIHRSWMIRHNDDTQTFEFGYGISNTFVSPLVKRAMWMSQRPSGNHQVVVGGNLNIGTSNINPNPEAALIVDGGLSVIGDVNITGRYMINATELVNSNVNTDFGLQTSLGNDDVYIAGGSVYVNPTTMLAVGYTSARVQAEINRPAVFRVYQKDPANEVIARFTCEGPAGYLEIANTTGKVVRLGFSGAPGFSIMNANNVPYLSFTTAASTNENMLAINAIKPVTANLHIQTTGVGSNMLRLSRYFASTNTGRNAPELEFENRFENDASLQFYDKWILRGPDTTYRQKFSMLYDDETDPEGGSEIFAFTNDGCFGIGNTQPEFALDVTASGTKGALRLYNTSNNGAPQVIFQSGSNILGLDTINDYRILSQSNTFTLDAVNTYDYQKLLFFDTSNNLGILGETNSNFNVNINGTLNVTKTIYLDGNPLFDTANSGSGEGFALNAMNIFLNPKVEYDGGVCINRLVPSTNLFHINAACNMNLAVFDSPSYNEAQIHLRTMTSPGAPIYNIYRLNQSNTFFQIEHNSNSGTDAYVSDSHINYKKVVRWGPSTLITGDYDVELWGSATLTSTAPKIQMGTSMIRHSNEHIYILPGTNGASNVGIGTLVPSAKLDISSSNANVAFKVQQWSNSDIARFHNSSGSQVISFTNSGSVGVGTTNPTSTLHVIGSTYISMNSNTTPLLSVSTVNCNVGIGTSVAPSKLSIWDSSLTSTSTHTISSLSPNIDQYTYNGLQIGKDTTSAGHAYFRYYSGGLNNNWSYITCGIHNTPNHFFTYTLGGTISSTSTTTFNSIKTIFNTSNLGIGTASPIERLHVVGNTTMTGNCYPQISTMQNLGASNFRWRDMYLANTIDLAGTQLSVNNTGYLRVNVNQIPTSVVANTFIMSNPVVGSNLEMKIGTTDPLLFVETNSQGTVTNQYVPFLKSDTTGGISVGTSSPQALLHIVGHTSIPTMILDHDNVAATSVLDVRDNGTTFTTFAKGGNVGIGTSAPGAKLDVLGTFRVSQQNAASNVATFRTTTNQTVVISNTGNVGIGTATPTDILHVHGSQTFNGVSTFKENVFMEKDIDVRGNSYVHGDQTTDSDLRLKTDIQRIKSALDKVCALSGYTFMKDGATVRGTGVVAQEVADVLPEAVHTNPDTGYLSVAYGNMMGLIIEAIKELNEKVDRVCSSK